MPKIEITTKYEKNDVVYLLFQNGIVRGIVRHANVYSVWGREEDIRCIHQQTEDKWMEIGEDPLDPLGPIVEYYVELEHPVITDIGQGKPVMEKIYGSSRMFRNPEALLASLKRKFTRIYGQDIKEGNGI